MKIIALILLLIASSAFAGELGFAQREDRLLITQGGQPIAEYVFRDAKIPRPYFAKLHAPDGTQVSRNFPPVVGTDATDHDTLHPGLWLAFGDLNGVDFWRNKGRIEHIRFLREPRVEGGRVAFAVEQKYTALNGREICRGVNEFAFVAGDTLKPVQPGTLILWSTTLRCAEGPLVFGPQHEMGLGFRMATPLIVKGGTGSIAGSHGGRNETGNWGRIGSWWNYSGTVGGKHAGILALAAADNARPVWAHARDYGFLAMNPTGPPPGAKDVPSLPFTIPAGEPLRMKFGLLLHASPAPLDAAAAAQAAGAELRAWKTDSEPAARKSAASAPRAVPTFECMSLYWDVPEGAAAKICAVKFRAFGDTDWRDAQPLWFDAKHRQYRGSVVNLRAGTDYEFSLALVDGPSAAVTARTWSNTFPIAATTDLPKGTTREPLRITDGGSAEKGHRLYTAAPEGTTIDVADAAKTCVSVEADYVILRGVTCRGARVDGVRVGNRHHVVIEGCDISGWGRRDAKAGQTAKLGGKEVKFLENLGAYLDAGIQVGGPLSAPACEQIVIQGNRIHHPRHTANNWTQASPYFSTGGRLSTHPQGPDAIVFAQQTRGRHVIRWNDLDGGDYEHMFNDALLAAEPKGNGFMGDGDIYGNRVAHCWDDGIEAERGDRNVRIWGNHFSRMIKCVSAGYIWEGPLYVWRNVAEELLHPHEMPAHNGGLSPFKAHPPCFMPPPQEDPKEQRDGVVFVYHNTLLAGAGHPAGWVFNAWPPHKYVSPSVRLISRNNVWQTRAYPAYFNTSNPEGVNYAVRDFDRSYFDQDYDLHSGVIAPAAAAGAHTRQGEPIFAKGHGAGTAGRYQLAEMSPGHDDAMRLANFNDDFQGQQPDRGAHETGAAELQYGTALWLRSFNPQPQARRGWRWLCLACGCGQSEFKPLSMWSVT
jgi:hypothetical protein